MFNNKLFVVLALIAIIVISGCVAQEQSPSPDNKVVSDGQNSGDDPANSGQQGTKPQTANQEELPPFPPE